MTMRLTYAEVRPEYLKRKRAIWLPHWSDDDHIMHPTCPLIKQRSQPTEEHRPRKLLDQVRDAIRLGHYSYRTEQAYVGWIKRYIYFHDGRHPSAMGTLEVEAFLTHVLNRVGLAVRSPLV
jgi:hypothetical protein